MPLDETPKKLSSFLLILFLLALCGGMLFFSLIQPVSFAVADPVSFEIKAGEGVQVVASNLASEHLIKSKLAFELLALVRLEATHLKPGIYKLRSSDDADAILRTMVSGPQEVVVTIPEGFSVYDIDKTLSAKHIITSGTLIVYVEKNKSEGYLFPDTYHFYESTPVEEVVAKMQKNFDAKARPILNEDPDHFATNLTLASLLENEVLTPEDRLAVASILKRRISLGMPLQVDATVCYAKELRASSTYTGCYPLVPLDFKIDSPYNTYLYKGWPPGSISSPGISAIVAAVRSTDKSPFLFYLSDPLTKKTIFSKTFEEHNKNRLRYLHR